MTRVRFAAALSLIALLAVATWRSTQRPESSTEPVAVPAADSPERAPAPAAKPSGTVAAATRSSATDDLAAFSSWLAAYEQAPAARKAELVTAGLSLAEARRASLKQLIRDDPAAALSAAIPAASRAALPASIAQRLEQPIHAFGDLEVVSICDNVRPRLDRWTTVGGQRYATYTYGRRLETASLTHTPIHGIAVDDVLALSDAAYQPTGAGDLDRAEGAVEVLVGDEVKRFESVAKLQAWSESVVTGTVAAPAIAAATATPWVTGEKTVLWIRAEFSDDPGSPATDDQINAAMTMADTLYREVSHNTCSLKATILPDTVKLAVPKATYNLNASSYSTLRSDAVQLARLYDATNGATGRYNPDAYDRYIVVIKKMPVYTWAGIGTVGGKGVVLNGTSTGAVTAHELGHNHGLRHSHAWAPSAGTATGAGTHVEYGDAFDDMGSGQSGNSGGHFNVVQKFNLGYLTSDSIQTVTQSGVYRLYRHDAAAASGIQALKLASPWTGVSYWLEHRRAAPYLGFVSPAAGRPELTRLQNGVVVHLDKAPPFATGPGTYLLDMTPTTMSGVPAPTDYDASISHFLDDSALALGESYTDATAGFTVTPVAVGGTAPNEWIDVYVSIGATTGNRAPSAVVAPNALTANARTDVTLQATGSDADGDKVYYHWDFGDGTIAPASATVTHRWLKGGKYTVKCTALDGRGGSSTTEVSVTVDDALLTWQRRAETLSTFSYLDVLFDGTKFVTVGNGQSATSVDGITWTAGTGLHNIHYAVAYGNSRYVAVGANATTTTAAAAANSSDGITWTEQTVPASAPNLSDVEFGAGRFVAIGPGGAILTSTNGSAWAAASSGVTADLNAIRYGGGRFLIAGVDGTYLTSTDGLSWENVSMPGETSDAYGLVYFQGNFLAVTGNYSTSDPSKRVAWLTSDGRTWTKLYIDIDFSVDGLASVGDDALLIGASRANDGRIFFAESPYEWTNATVATPTLTNSYLEAVAEGNGTLVIVGRRGQLYTPIGKPLVAATPSSRTVYSGETVTLNVRAFATGPFTYQWKKDGVAITGATNATLNVSSAATANAGSYTVTVTNSSGSLTTAAAVLAVTDVPQVNPGRLNNLSIRTAAGKGDQTVIVGISVGGGAAGAQKPLLIRGVGPTLASYGVSGAIADPVLALYKSGATTALATNDGWRGDPQISAMAQAVGAFPLAAASADAALYRSLDTSGYTVQVAGNTGTGIALVEVYDASTTFTTATPRLTNVSARALVGTGDNVLIAGFNITGSTSRKVLIRAIGPTLGSFGVGGALADSKLELYRGSSTKIAENDNWAGSADLEAAAKSVGAFALSPTSKDAVLLVDLQPGLYSAVIRGVGDATGVALVEVYEVP